MTADDVPGGGPPRGLGALAALLAALGLAGAASALGHLPAAVGTASGAVLFFGGGALVPLARLSPVEPSLLKIVTLAALFSPVLASAVHVLVSVVAPGAPAVAATFAVLALVQATGRGARVHVAPLGPAARLAVALALGLGVLTAVLLLRGSAARASYHGLLHSTLVLAVDRGVPPTNPYLAGEPLGYYWYWHAWGTLVARGLSVAPTVALALLQVWSATVLPLALYFLAAPLFSNGRRELAGVALALFGLNSLGGFLWLSKGAPWSTPRVALESIEVLSASVGAWDRRLAFGLSKLGNLSSYPAALTLLAGGWMAAAHALRGGVGPWVGACAVALGASFAVNPIVGGSGLASTGLAALVFCPGLRARLLVPLAVAALPGLGLVLLAGRAYAGETVSVVLDAGRPWATLAPVLVLALAAPAGVRAALVGESSGASTDASSPAERRRGRVAGLLLASAALPLALHLVVQLPYNNEYKLVRIAAVPLGLLAGGGVVALLASGSWRRAVGALLALTLVVGGGAVHVLGLRTYLAVSSRSLPLDELPLALSPTGGGARGEELSETYSWLRERGVRAAPEVPALVVNALSPGVQAWGEAGDEHAFTDPRLNLQGHEAAPFTGLPLFWDRQSQALDPRSVGWEERREVVRRLYGAAALADADLVRLAEAGHGALVLVTDVDRALLAANGSDPAAIDAKLAAAGLARVFERSGTAVYELEARR